MYYSQGVSTIIPDVHNDPSRAGRNSISFGSSRAPSTVDSELQETTAGIDSFKQHTRQCLGVIDSNIEYNGFIFCDRRGKHGSTSK